MIPHLMVLVAILVILPCVSIFLEVYYIEASLSYPIYLTYFSESIIITVIVYALLTYSLTTKKYFNETWLEDLVIEHQFLKKLLYIGLPMLIIVLFVFLSNFEQEPNFLLVLFPGLVVIVGGALLRFIFNVRKKDFRFDYAKGCIVLLSKNTDEPEKMNLLIRALNSYNKYLKRILKLQMSSIDNICSRIISDALLDKQELTKSVSVAFENDNKMKPAKQILVFLNGENSDHFFVKEPLGDKIKEWGTFLAGIIPLVISVVIVIIQSLSNQPLAPP